MSNFEVNCEVAGTAYVAERQGNGAPFYVRERGENQILFDIPTTPTNGGLTAEQLARFVRVFEDGRAAGFAAGSLYGADQVRREFQKVLGVDLIGDALAELTAAVRELSGVRR